METGLTATPPARILYPPLSISGQSDTNSYLHFLPPVSFSGANRTAVLDILPYSLIPFRVDPPGMHLSVRSLESRQWLLQVPFPQEASTLTWGTPGNPIGSRCSGPWRPGSSDKFDQINKPPESESTQWQTIIAGFCFVSPQPRGLRAIG